MWEHTGGRGVTSTLTHNVELHVVANTFAFSVVRHTAVHTGTLSLYFLQHETVVRDDEANIFVCLKDLILWEKEQDVMRGQTTQENH